MAHLRRAQLHCAGETAGDGEREPLPQEGFEAMGRVVWLLKHNMPVDKPFASIAGVDKRNATVVRA